MVRTVYSPVYDRIFVFFPAKITIYIHRIYMVLANPNHDRIVWKRRTAACAAPFLSSLAVTSFQTHLLLRWAGCSWYQQHKLHGKSQESGPGNAVNNGQDKPIYPEEDEKFHLMLDTCRYRQSELPKRIQQQGQGCAVPLFLPVCIAAQKWVLLHTGSPCSSACVPACSSTTRLRGT